MSKFLLVLVVGFSVVGCGSTLRASVETSHGPDYLAEIRETCEHGPAHRVRAVGRPMISESGVEIRCF